MRITLPDSLIVAQLALALAGLSMLVLAVLTGRRRRNTPAGIALTGLMLGGVCYAFGYAGELAATCLPAALAWVRFQYLGIATMPAAFILTALLFTGRRVRTTAAALFFIIPLATLILVFTAEEHGLLFQNPRLGDFGGLHHLVFERGPWYWVQIGYIYLSIIWGGLIFGRLWLKARPPDRTPVGLMLLGSLSPGLGGLAYLTGLSPFGLDLSPFGLVVTGLLYTIGVLRFNLFGLAPLARNFVFEGLRDAVLVLDRYSRLVDYNPAALRAIEGLCAADLGKPVGELPGLPASLLEFLRSAAHGRLEVGIPDSDPLRWFSAVLSAVQNRRGKTRGRSLVLTEITDQVRMRVRLERLATIDELTGTVNRRHFLELCERELIQARRKARPVSFALMDLDRFKQINDNYGHTAGDQALVAVVAVLREGLRRTDLLGRYGGDEFALFFPETAIPAALAIIERLRDRIAAAPLLFESASLSLTATFGLTGLDSPDEETPDTLFRRADEALYAAKQAGRNRVMTS